MVYVVKKREGAKSDHPPGGQLKIYTEIQIGRDFDDRSFNLIYFWDTSQELHFWRIPDQA